MFTENCLKTVARCREMSKRRMRRRRMTRIIKEMKRRRINYEEEGEFCHINLYERVQYVYRKPSRWSNEGGREE